MVSNVNQLASSPSPFLAIVPGQNLFCLIRPGAWMYTGAVH